jgi:hypothetical protein
MQIPDSLLGRRLENWRQTPATKLGGVDDAPAFIEAAGIVTLYPVSPEIPNLFHAYLGDPEAKTDSAWDTPSGQVYTWRWILGRKGAAFYTAIVRNRPTFVRWSLLPAVLALRGELRMPDELFDLGILSADAYRITQALEDAGGVLGTGDLRRASGFPTGKEQRAAYLKAVAELDARLILAKVFSSNEDEDMQHALVREQYPDAVAAAEGMSREDALEGFLRAYLPLAVYAVPPVLARHLKLPPAEVSAGVEALVREGAATSFGGPGAAH